MISKSTTDSQHSEILSPVYFPFTFISPSLLEAMSLCFNRLVVYQPAHSRPQKALQPWIDRGLLNVRSPFETVIDKKSVEAALHDFRSWGLLHQHADMAYLKMVGNYIAPVDPETARIASDIRAMAATRRTESEESELSSHLFLHLAQEFDRHSWELREQLNRLNDRYRALQGSFRQDESGESRDPTSEELFLVTEKDPRGFMIKKRMAAWNHLFQQDTAGPGLLFTDSPPALAYLLDKVQEKVEALNFSITSWQADSRETAKNHPAWAHHFRETLNTVLTTPWSRTLQERVLEAGREIEARIDHRRRSRVKPHDRSVSFRWYVLPRHVAHSVLNRCCGVESGDEEDRAVRVKNTLVGLIEEGRHQHQQFPVNP
jgi:hypothetical protein